MRRKRRNEETLLVLWQQRRPFFRHRGVPGLEGWEEELENANFSHFRKRYGGSYVDLSSAIGGSLNRRGERENASYFQPFSYPLRINRNIECICIWRGIRVVRLIPHSYLGLTTIGSLPPAKVAHKPSKVYVDLIVFRRQVHVIDSAYDSEKNFTPCQ